MDRITNMYAFLGSIAGLIVPTILLMMYDYFKHQKEVLVLKEQKKTTELNLLKSQLNPHFLFNTLNNLYTLALKKSDRTPEVIAKLSDILDYMLYQCKDDFVSLKSEVNLLNNYIELEKIRYGKRLNLTFNHTIEDDFKIAPLLLLTFVENAFKHGISQEISIGTIQIMLQAKKNEIYFKIENSKPTLKKHKSNNKRDSIGLENIRKQLEILYNKNNYILNINEDNTTYSVILKLIPNEI
jgi:sensor histidine kinase YesM